MRDVRLLLHHNVAVLIVELLRRGVEYVLLHALVSFLHSIFLLRQLAQVGHR